jgi:HSP20 family molecular chaperone IbpA
MPELWRLIDLERDWDSLFRFPGAMTEAQFRPSVDVARKEGQLIVTAELPGIDPDKDVEITLDDDYLTIGGEKSEEREMTSNDRVVHERRYGSFVRRVPVPEGVSADKITASYVDGVLTITVTLPEETQPLEPRKIPVSSTKT